jgi:preprotein translocase subunit SecD
MGTKIRNRIIIIVVVTLIGLYLIFKPQGRWPNGKDLTSWSQVKENLSKNINLGLDLRGGSHLLMQVQANDVITGYTQKDVDAAKNALQQKNWPFNDIKTTGPGQITITVPDRTHDSDIIGELNSQFNDSMPNRTGWRANEIGNSIVYTLDQTEQNELREKATQQAEQIIEQRVNAFGVAEPTIQ